MQIGLGSVLRDQISLGIIPTRENLAQLSARLREEYGLAVLVDFAISKSRTSDNKNLIVNGIRHPAEAKKIKEIGGLCYGLMLRYHCDISASQRMTAIELKTG